MESQTIFRYVLNRLSVMSDEELLEIDFSSGMNYIENSDITEDDKKNLKRLFTAIQKELPVTHHGVKGMRWGVRRYQNKDGSLTAAGKQRLADEAAKQSIFGTATRFQIKTKSGETITAEPVKPWSAGKKILKTLLGESEKTTMGLRGDANYTLCNSKGEKIGELSLISKNSKTSYLDWITIDDSQRGKGYATDVINNLLRQARDSGYSKVELNALKKPRALYERMGFTYASTSNMSIMDRINSFEFGCKHMEYDLTNIRHSEGTLIHYGVRGMRWGVRRYQNKDGTLTPAGKKRQASEELASQRKKAKEKGETPKADPKSWVKDDLERSRRLANESTTMTRNLRELNRATQKTSSSKRMDLSSMSDKEMRDRINRELLERQYINTFDPPTVSRGRQRVDRVLEIGGAVLATTSTALGIALAIKELRG